MLFGLALGLLVALAVYVRFAPEPPPLPEPPQQPEPLAKSAASPPKAAPREAKPRPENNGDGQNRFDFYEMLPRFEVVVPEVETEVDAGGAAAPVKEPGLYVLQVGSFRAQKDADRLQASLALLGIESRIQRVAVDDETFHRVRIGPSSDLDEINRIRRRLHEQRIDSLLMRVQEEP